MDPRSCALFNSPSLVNMAFHLPPPISQNDLLHRRIIQRFMPHTYWLPVNTNKYMPLMKYPRLSKLTCEGLLRFHKGISFLKEALSGKPTPKSHESLMGDTFVPYLQQEFRDVLLAKDSIARNVLDQTALTNLLDEHMAGRNNWGHILGLLATLEQWNRLISDTMRMVKHPDHLK
ncbi:MAG: hypothetical protein JW828_06180 [Sedimentisphaerales bacterium]|nr:hypothetical protein [Sedimentisphaerales bacterium]